MNKLKTILGGALVIIAGGYAVTAIKDIKRRKEVKEIDIDEIFEEAE